MTIKSPCEGAAPWAFEADEVALLLLEAWGELISPETTDSFRARLMDLPTILEELRDVSLLATKSQKWVKHVGVVQEELRVIARSESKWLADRPDLGNLIDACTKNGLPAADVTRLVTLALTQFGNPLGVWTRDLYERVNALRMPRSELVLHRLGTIATHAVRNQVDYEQLSGPLSDTDVIFAPRQQAAEAICATVRTRRQRYECYLAVTERKSGDLFAIVKGSNIRQSVPEKVGKIGLCGADFVAAHAAHLFVEISPIAEGFWLAGADAYRTLSWHADIFNFYSHSNSLSISSKVLIVDTAGEGQCIDLSDAPKLMKPRKARRKLTIGTVSEPHGELTTGRIRAALEQYSIAVEAKDTSVALSTLWTALETLVGPSGPDTILERVVHWVAPTVAWRRTNKILRYLCIKLHEFGIGTAAYPAVSMPKSTRAHVDMSDLCAVLKDDDTGALITTLHAAVGSRPLIQTRVFKTWEGFREASAVASDLKSSLNRIRWNIWRIYRARNLWVHQGVRTALTLRLFEHLHYYFSVVASGMLSTLRQNPGWEADVALEHLRMTYELGLEKLERSPDRVTFDYLAQLDLGGVKIWA